ncbi:tyrosine-protein phosphatase [Aliiroseovarius sp. PrR006]|uniref:phosphatase domain-containing protein n=1 Tax=Aliiroseovarius sp. PrR006 TaxID=2706883 RepID=UPI0013D0F9F1|nr:tyrosine-protein phosphatase [Aliiroseovarius sp. PrR006]NDW53595.1 dual specificity protein phosphatase family protein [Aliiroseovarius sp. PrR006]
MFRSLYAKIKQREHAWKHQFGMDISTPEGRRAARLRSNIIDHSFIRRILPNRHQLSPDAWRSNQPDPVHFPALQAAGIKTVINLRGESKLSHYLFEAEACRDYGMTLIDHQMTAYAAKERKVYLDLLDIMERAEKPFLVHCKSGADRTGIASALYLLDQCGATPDEARAQLSLKYAHQRWTKAGILTAMINAYADHHKNDAISIRDWLAQHYDPETITQAFQAKRKK